MKKLKDMVYKCFGDKDTLIIYTEDMRIVARGNWYQDHILDYMDRSVEIYDHNHATHKVSIIVH